MDEQSALASRIAALDDNVSRLLTIVDGDDSLGVRGMRHRLKDLEDIVAGLKDDRDRVELYAKGFVVGITVNVLGVIILVITVAQLLQRLP